MTLIQKGKNMEEKTDVMKLLENYGLHLLKEEKSPLTIEKYRRDIKKFLAFKGCQELDKKLVLRYKEMLLTKYAVSSINSMLVALNGFFKYIDRYDLIVKLCKVQQRVFCDESRELEKHEYLKLLECAKRQKKERILLILETLAGTGIRIGELPFITVRAVEDGRAEVRGKGKNRSILLSNALRSNLRGYIKRKGITNGPVFISRNGTPIHRSTVWREMKSLCVDAGIPVDKVFPHNMRHLFARVYYDMEKDIAKLADLLGHSSIETTRIYIISSGKEHLKQIEMLGLVI